MGKTDDLAADVKTEFEIEGPSDRARDLRSDSDQSENRGIFGPAHSSCVYGVVVEGITRNSTDEVAIKKSVLDVTMRSISTYKQQPPFREWRTTV